VSPGSRGIFDDRCNSGDKLVREWLQGTPANWSQAYLSPYQTYRVVNGAASVNTLMSMPPASNFEVDFKFFMDNASPELGCYLRKGRNTTDGELGDILALFISGTLRLYFCDPGFTLIVSPALVLDITKWYQFKAQIINRTVRYKAWIVGTSEPDWLATQYLTRWYMKKNGTIGIRSGANNKNIADIRITPIPKTGGVP